MSAPLTTQRSRPVKPVSKFDPNVYHTPRDYADHLNLMLDYYIDLSKWLESSLTARENALREIALAGMSMPPMCSKEDERRFHAQQAWNFIGIAAREIAPQPEHSDYYRTDPCNQPENIR